MVIREKFIWAAINRAYASTGPDIYNDEGEEIEFLKIIFTDKHLTNVEKKETINLLIKLYNWRKVLDNEGIKRNCENCKKECLATLHCEHCMRN